MRVELDRESAIRAAVLEAAPGDVVMVLGKGTEATQEVNGRLFRFSDARAARAALEARTGGAAEPRVAIGCESAVLLRARGEAIVAYHADVPHPPASLVKLMTLYVALEAVACGRAGLDEAVTISDYAALTPHPRLSCRPGDRVRLRTLLAATAFRSSNLAATAVAEHVAGSEAAFVERMNATGRALGLAATRFETPHGLPHPRQVSTARDLALLLSSLVRDHPHAARMLRQRRWEHRGRRYVRPFRLFRDPGGITALKTGYTELAGFNLAVSATRGEAQLVAVVLGGITRGVSLDDAGTLLRFGFGARSARPSDGASGPAARRRPS